MLSSVTWYEVCVDVCAVHLVTEDMHLVSDGHCGMHSQQGSQLLKTHTNWTEKGCAQMLMTCRQHMYSDDATSKVC